MTFIIGTLVIALGVIIFSFTVGNTILILFFAIPFTKKLERAYLLKHNNIIKGYIFSLLIQIIILFAITIFFYIYFLDSCFISLIIGYSLGVFGIITKIKEFGLNMNNFSDYFERNKNYFLEELVDKYNNDMGELLKFIVAITAFKDNK